MGGGNSKEEEERRYKRQREDEERHHEWQKEDEERHHKQKKESAEQTAKIRQSEHKWDMEKQEIELKLITAKSQDLKEKNRHKEAMFREAKNLWKDHLETCVKIGCTKEEALDRSEHILEKSMQALLIGPSTSHDEDDDCETMQDSASTSRQ